MKLKTWFKIVQPIAQANGMEDAPAEVMIFDDIGAWGIGAKDFTEAFNAIKAQKINVRINSGGGDFFDGCAMYSTIRDHAAEVTCHVEGLAASAASVVAIAGDKVCIASNAFMMIHNVMTMAFGNGADLRKQADLLDKLSGSTAALYASKTGKTPAEMQQLMDDESWFDAREAKSIGLVDEIKDPDDEEDDDDSDLEMSAVFRAVATYRKAPEQLRRFAASLAARKGNEGPGKAAKGKTAAGNNAVKQETPAMANKITLKDGKQYVTINGVEHELEASAPAATTTVDLDKAVNEARTKAVAEERAYRGMFSTIVQSAGLKDAAAVADFEKNFYGRAESDLKFLAQHAIGTRAKPLGEGSGEPEPVAGAKTDADKAAREIREYCADRFATDASMRRRFKVNSTNIEDAGYKAGLDRYVAVETKCRADEAKPTKKSREDEDKDPEGDVISRTLKNPSLFSRLSA
jgi:ATP-dependent protease ClpP protease subunit